VQTQPPRLLREIFRVPFHLSSHILLLTSLRPLREAFRPPIHPTSYIPSSHIHIPSPPSRPSRDNSVSVYSLLTTHYPLLLRSSPALQQIRDALSELDRTIGRLHRDVEQREIAGFEHIIDEGVARFAVRALVRAVVEFYSGNG
jgi:hypothetical protein